MAYRLPRLYNIELLYSHIIRIGSVWVKEHVQKDQWMSVVASKVVNEIILRASESRNEGETEQWHIFTDKSIKTEQKQSSFENLSAQNWNQEPVRIVAP